MNRTDVVHRVRFSSALLARIVAAAQASPAVEVCGLLLGTPDRIDGVSAARNVAADPRTSFEIDPATLFAAHRKARAGGRAVVGCYHSHPNGRAEPSARDLAAATPGQLWLIVADGRARLFVATSEGFAPATIARTDAD